MKEFHHPPKTHGMKKLATLVFFLLAVSSATAQEWETPVIKGYGKIKNFKDAAVQPDNTLDYNLVFDIKDAQEKEGVNAGLFKIARTINMLGAAKIAPEKIKIVAALHGEASFYRPERRKISRKVREGQSESGIDTPPRRIRGRAFRLCTGDRCKEYFGERPESGYETGTFGT